MLERSTPHILLVLCLATILVGASTAPAAAETPNAGWEVMSNTRPTNLEPGARGLVEIMIFNVGAGAPKGKITVTDTLPVGVIATDTGLLATPFEGTEVGPSFGLGHGIETSGTGRDPWECVGVTIVTCTGEPTSNTVPDVGGGAGAGIPITLGIMVAVEKGVEGAFPNVVTVTGGGAITTASTTHAVTLSSRPAGFGFSNWDVWFSNEDGTIDTQAGSHPYAATFAFDLATHRARGHVAAEMAPETEAEYLVSEKGKDKATDIEGAGGVGGSINTIEAELPPGLVGNPHAVQQCTRVELNKAASCPPASQIGIIRVFFGDDGFSQPVFNMVTPPNAPAEFGFTVEQNYLTFLDSFVRSGSDYGITTHVNNIPEVGVEGSILTLWGDPTAKSHDAWRGNGAYGSGCAGTKEEGNPDRFTRCKPESVQGVSPQPFLTLPTSCAGPQTFTIRATTWENTSIKAEYSTLSHDSEDDPVGFTGCEQLDFNPQISLSPDSSQADTPTGLTAEVRPPVGGLSELGGLSTSDVQNTTVVLPEGVAINPGQAAGLEACGPSQDGLTTEAEKAEGRENAGPAECPAASKVGTVSIETPLLAQRLEGSVYVLQSNPPHLKLLIAASAEGVNVKLVGEVHLNEVTGQLTTTFQGTPELPFTDFKLAFSGGAQAALATPTQCGRYTSTADFTPWSSPMVAEVMEESSFAITAGTDGAPCPPDRLPFTPSLIAGSTTDQAAGYTDFSVLLQAPDDQERIHSLQFKVPQGLLGMLSKVPLCSEAQANAGTCSEASKIGHTTVASGPGPYPLVVPQPGEPPANIYLTEKYDGAPFGLSIVTPVLVGPFNLGVNVVRARIEVDPHTAQITVTTDSTGEHAIPQVLDGVPTDLRSIDAVIDRPEFMFNPSSCNPMSFSGLAWGTPPPGASGGEVSAPISTPFQMGSCRSLLFKPNFTVSVSAKSSRADGESLVAKLNYPTGALGHNQASSQSNLKAFKVDLPKQLPSRLTTLQKACPEKEFEANPAMCPAASRVGRVKIVTPVLPVPLEGPAYFVSHGGAKFPELIFVVQGDGVTIYVDGETFINPAGITSDTLRTVPDAPIASFELTLPEGPYSALAANGNLCKDDLKMPTAMTGQDGAEVHQNTPIKVTGCAKPKKAKKAKKVGRRHKGRAHGKK